MRAPEFWQRGTDSAWPWLLAPLAWGFQGASWMRWRLVAPDRKSVV